MFAPEQSCSKRGKGQICYHIYTDVMFRMNRNYRTTLIWQLQRLTVKIEVQTCFESSVSFLLFERRKGSLVVTVTFSKV